MININFYIKIHELKKEILSGKKFEREEGGEGHDYST